MLCELLAATGIAGKPAELLNTPDDVTLLEYHQAPYADLQQKLWEKGSTSNGVFGLKASMIRPKYQEFTLEFQQCQGVDARNRTEPEIWAHSFPNLQYIFLTRRNKVRQAVSWWKAILTGEWHRTANNERPYDPNTIRDRYDFAAIRHLLIESTLREAATQDFLKAGGLIPLTLVYEDLIADPEGTIRKVITYLGIADQPFTFSPPSLKKMADELTEEWVERFRKEVQGGWKNVVW